MNALAYLDFCYARNSLATVLKSPARLVLWAAYGLFIAMMIFVRSVPRRSTYSVATPHFATIAIAAGGLALLFTGGAILFASYARVAAFRSRGEAWLLSSSGLPAPTIALWMQLRKLAAAATRWGPIILFYLFVASPPGVKVGGLGHWFFAGVAFAALTGTLQLPVSLSAQRAKALPFRIAGVALAAGGLFFLIAGAAAAFNVAFGTRALAWLPWTPGPAAAALARGDPAALSALALVTLMLVASVAWLARDALPELYEMSVRVIEYRESRRSGRARAGSAAQQAVRSRAGYVPAGAAALIWKDWLGFVRTRGARWWVALCVVAAAAGVFAGLRTFADSDVVASIALNSAVLVALIATTASSVSLADDVAKPIWWLSAAPLRERLWAWTLAKTWRTALVVALVLFFASIARGNVVGALLALPASIVALWSLTAIGVALYSAFPSPLERGPVMVARTFATFAVLLPSAALFIIASIVTSITIAAIAACGLLLLEGIVLLELAALRLVGNGAGVARAETAR